MGAPQAVNFKNGQLDHKIVMVHGPEAVPTMSVNAMGQLVIAGVQQGDKIIVQDMNSGASDRMAVVKDMSWNDYQRIGGKLTFTAAEQNLPQSLKTNIASTITFALDPRPNSAQAVQRVALAKQLAVTYPGKNYAALAIPSALAVGPLPWDFDHGHLASSVALPAAFVTQANNFVQAEITASKMEKITGGVDAPPPRHSRAMNCRRIARNTKDFSRPSMRNTTSSSPLPGA